MELALAPLLDLGLHGGVPPAAAHGVAAARVPGPGVRQADPAVGPQGPDGPVVVAVVGALLQEHQVVGRGDVGVAPLDLQPTLLGRLDAGRSVVRRLEVVACNKSNFKYFKKSSERRCLILRQRSAYSRLF